MSKSRKPGSLKEACHQLVERSGGQKVAARFWGCSVQNVARMTDSDCEQHPPRIDQILVLEAHCKDPIVTRFMAGERGCLIEPVNCSNLEPLPMIMGRITKETGEVLTSAAAAFTTGRLTATQAALVLRETDDVICAMVQLRGECREVLAESGAQ